MEGGKGGGGGEGESEEGEREEGEGRGRRGGGGEEEGGGIYPESRSRFERRRFWLKWRSMSQTTEGHIRT